MMIVCAEIKRVLKKIGSFWLNMGDTYGGSGCGKGDYRNNNKRSISVPMLYSDKPNPQLKLRAKCLVGIPWRLVLRLIDEQGWILRNAVVWHKCLSGNTPIYARSQERPLRSSVREIARLPLDNLYIAGSNGWRKVIRIEKQEARKLLTIHLRNGMRIEVTPEHRFLVGDNLITANQLKKGDQFKHTKLPDEVGTPLGNELVGWAVGFYLAEGSKTGKSIQFSMNSKEKNYADKLKRFAYSFAGKYKNHIYENNLTTVLSGAAVTGIINEYVTGTGAHTKHLSRSAFTENNSFLKAVLDGYLAGDGHYDHKNNRWRLGFAKNRELEWDLRTICARLGFHMRAFLAKAKIGEREYPCIRGEIREKTTGHFNQKDDYEILRIEETKGITFDIEVDGDHLFALADGSLVHNSNAMPSSVKDRCSNSYEFLFHLVKNTEPQYYWNKKTGLMADRKSKELKENIDWEWQECPKCSGAGKYEEKICPRCKGTGKIKHSFWHSLGYWYDLDAIREPHKESFLKDKRIQRIRQGEELTHKRWKDYQGTKAQDPCNARDSIMKTFNPAGKNPGDVWTITTQPRPEAHFACFPDKLTLLPILATCPTQVCKKCGKIRVRITKKPDMSQRPKRSKTAKTFEDKHLGFKERSAGQKYQEWRNENPDITIGWTTCSCGEKFEPGILLDPFAGRGTALIMAKKMGRHYVGYELSKEYYTKLIQPALDDIDPLFQARKKK